MNFVALDAIAALAGKDFYTEVQKGTVYGHSIVHKFGRNDAVASGGGYEFVSLLSGATSFLSAATTVQIKAGGNAADSNVGAGAREVTVQGLDATGALVSEAITTNGASASTATSTAFLRLFRAYVSSAGTYGSANTAAITIEDSGSAADLITILAEEGQSFYAGYSVPLGKTAYLLSAVVSVDATQNANIRLRKRDSLTSISSAIEANRIQLQWQGLPAGLHYYAPRSPLAFDALTDVWWEAQGGAGTTKVSVDFELLLVDDGCE